MFELGNAELHAIFQLVNRAVKKCKPCFSYENMSSIS